MGMGIKDLTIGPEQRHSIFRGWFRCRHMRARENRKLRADCQQMVLAALASCPPIQEYPRWFLRIRYNRYRGRWETVSLWRGILRDIPYTISMLVAILGIMAAWFTVCAYFHISTSTLM